MEHNHLISLRLGFSTTEAETIKKNGVADFISRQLKANHRLEIPDFMANGPKSMMEIQQLKKAVKKVRKEINKINFQLKKVGFQWKAFLIQRCFETENPLREKINLFFHNHFVVSLETVRVPYWIYQHYDTINSLSMGNYKTLVKEMIYSNALIYFLNNDKNRKGKINENLGRELLELFTLGEGHYSESDTKNAALSLAGLGIGKNKGKYLPKFKDNSIKTFMGKSGNFIIDDVIDIIFEQENTPYFLAEKVLKWFYYDDSSDELIKQYGDILKMNDFELKPFFEALFLTESEKTSAGTHIKNPLEYTIQIYKDLNMDPNFKFMSHFIKNQAMDLYDQPNVKGWKGGKNWLTTQIYADRNQFMDIIINGNKKFEEQLMKKLKKYDIGTIQFNPKLDIKDKTDAGSILHELTQKMIFQTNDDMLEDLDEILKYDFDPTSENADKSILKVYHYLAKTAEFQLI
ncbi:MAG: DUF1800 domain-containing protein [Bacteroidetes bacterium]|nr:DUF1800 domain-containing protein [Bacteroidota bacterium]